MNLQFPLHQDRLAGKPYCFCTVQMTNKTKLADVSIHVCFHIPVLSALHREPQTTLCKTAAQVSGHFRSRRHNIAGLSLFWLNRQIASRLSECLNSNVWHRVYKWHEDRFIISNNPWSFAKATVVFTTSISLTARSYRVIVLYVQQHAGSDAQQNACDSKAGEKCLGMGNGGAMAWGTFFFSWINKTWMAR